MPHAFTYLIAYFFLAGVRLALSVDPPKLNIYFQGPQYHNHPCLDLSKRPIFVRLFRKHISWTGTGDHVCRKRVRVLGRAEAFENSDEDNGELHQLFLIGSQ